MKCYNLAWVQRKESFKALVIATYFLFHLLLVNPVSDRVRNYLTIFQWKDKELKENGGNNRIIIKRIDDINHTRNCNMQYIKETINPS